MNLQVLDLAIVVAYIVAVFAIAAQSGRFLRRNFKQRQKDGLLPMENHYLAGKSITFWEALLSIIATEFSALAFLTIPTYSFFDNMSYVRFVIGACLSRFLITAFFIPKIYGKGLTIFEILARGINGYLSIRAGEQSGQRVFAVFYVGTKLLGTSVKLLAGSILVAEFFRTSVFATIVIIAVLTYLYLMLGGLKAVVRTDMVQALVFIFGGVIAHYTVAELSGHSWTELLAQGYVAGKFHLFGSGGVSSFFYGLLAGIAYDAATHGVDQDISQKLLGARDERTARLAVTWSALGSLLVNLLFLTLGVILWSYYQSQGLPLPRPERIFSSFIENNFPSPMKGLMIASILAACMSTLDSSINALSSCLWNDIMHVEKSRFHRLYIHLDNFIMTVAIIIAAYIFSNNTSFMRYGMYFSYLSTAPLLAFFLCRLLLHKYIKISYTPSIIILSAACCFLGMALNHIGFHFSPQLTIPWGVFTCICFMWLYAQINRMFLHDTEDRQ